MKIKDDNWIVWLAVIYFIVMSILAHVLLS